MLKLRGGEPVNLMLKLKEEHEIDVKSPLSSMIDAIVARCTDGGADFRRLSSFLVCLSF